MPYRLALLLLEWLLIALFVVPARAAEPVIEPALDGIFAAFGKYPLVALADQHELGTEQNFYAAVIKDPRFATTVGNVVVEFGASQHQAILDRYLAGEAVAYGEIAKVWRNTVAWNPTVTTVGYQNFFAQVRAVNISLAADQRIHVLLSEPPIDWTSIETKDAWQRIYDQRDPHIAEAITREILERRKKALVIYGHGHLFPYPWPSTMPLPPGGIVGFREIVERTHPNTFYVITPYIGNENPSCSAAIEAQTKWPNRVLVAPIRGTPVETVLMRSECMTTTLRGVDPLPAAEEQERLKKSITEIQMGVAGDALLYMRPAAELMRSSYDPTMWMDVDYNAELARRSELRGERPFPFADLLTFLAVPPQWWQQRPQ